MNAPFVRKRLVIIESDTEVKEVLELILIEMGHDVHPMLCRDDLAKTILDTLPQIILIDQSHYCNGLRLLTQLKQQDFLKGTPVIVLSVELGMEEQAMAAGADAFIEKPFDIEILRSTIDRWATA